jgi:Na+/H+ antiporter NhaD/arsenite permease-like protein
VSIHVIGIIGLIVIFIIGTLRPINIGALALVMTYLVSTLFSQDRLPDIYSGFPVDLLILLAGVTYLFGVAVNNGTVEWIVEGATRLFKGRRALIPWIVFVVASLPAMAGALGSAGVAMLAPLSLRLAKRYDIDRRMIGLMVVHGAAAGNFSPLNVLGAIVRQAVVRSGLELSTSALFFGNLAYNIVLAVIIYVVFGGLRLAMPVNVPSGEAHRDGSPRQPLRTDQLCTLVALLGVAVAALGFDLSIGFLAFAAAAVLQLLFPASSGRADQKIAWGVVLLVCGIVTYVAALQRFGTVQAIGDAIAALDAPLLTALLICAVGAITSAFASSAGILGAMIPLAVPFMARGDVATTGMVVALAVSATVVDSTPFSTVGALVVANAEDDERAIVYRGLLAWGMIMVVTAPIVTWLVFIVA